MHYALHAGDLLDLSHKDEYVETMIGTNFSFISLLFHLFFLSF